MLSSNTKKQLTALGLAVLLTLPVVALAQTANPQSNCDKFLDQFPGIFDWAKGKGQFCTLSGIMLYLINFGIAIAGGFSVLFLIIGGFRYLTAGGDTEAVEKGKGTITNAVIGLAVVLLAGMIIRLVSNTVTGGSGGTSTTPPGGQQGGGGGGGTTPPAGNAQAAIAGLSVQWPTSLVPGGRAVFLVTANPAAGGGQQAFEAGLSAGCGGAAISNVGIQPKVNGNNTTPSKLTNTNGTSQILLDVPSNASGQYNVELTLCGGLTLPGGTRTYTVLNSSSSLFPSFFSCRTAGALDTCCGAGGQFEGSPDCVAAGYGN